MNHEPKNPIRNDDKSIDGSEKLCKTQNLVVTAEVTDSDRLKTKKAWFAKMIANKQKFSVDGFSKKEYEDWIDFASTHDVPSDPQGQYVTALDSLLMQIEIKEDAVVVLPPICLWYRLAQTASDTLGSLHKTLHRDLVYSIRLTASLYYMETPLVEHIILSFPVSKSKAD